MLFDLRGRGRHRTVQIVYTTLAVLMAAGLILFGVGSGLAGGLIDAVNGGGGSSNSASSNLSKQADTLQKRAQQNPQDASDLGAPGAAPSSSSPPARSTRTPARSPPTGARTCRGRGGLGPLPGAEAREAGCRHARR